MEIELKVDSALNVSRQFREMNTVRIVFQNIYDAVLNDLYFLLYIGINDVSILLLKLYFSL